MAVAIVLGVQNHEDHVLTAQITQTEAELRLHNRYNPEVWCNTSEIIALRREINDVTKKEASVIRDMHSFPEQEQVQFWHEESMPLIAQEHALRERLLVAGQKVSQERSTQ